MTAFPLVYIPHNPQEHDNRLRAIAVAHMGVDQGNPTQWVVTALHHCWQEAFAAGMEAQRNMKPAPPIGFSVAVDPKRATAAAEAVNAALRITTPAPHIPHDDDIEG